MNWIKMRTALIDDPRVLVVSAKCPALAVTVVGCLHALWSLADRFATEDGVLEGYTPAYLNARFGVPNFCESLPNDWIDLTGDWIKLPEYQEHNGTTAKTRALDSKRKKNVRKMSEKCPPPRGTRSYSKSKSNSKSPSDLSNSSSGSDSDSNSKSDLPKHCPALPPSLDNPEGIAAVCEWDRYKRERGEGYKSDRGWSAILEEFQDLGGAALTRAVKNSMKNNWAGLFPDKTATVRNQTAETLAWARDQDRKTSEAKL